MTAIRILWLDPMKFEQQRRDGFRRRLVEVPRGFITQHQTGLADQRPGNGDTLSFPTGELGRPMVDSVSQSYLLDQ